MNDKVKNNLDILKGGMGSGRKTGLQPIKDHSQWEHGKHELQISSAYGDGKFQDKGIARENYKRQFGSDNKGGTSMVAMHDGSHVVTNNRRASIFEKQGSGKILSHHEVYKSSESEKDINKADTGINRATGEKGTGKKPDLSKHLDNDSNPLSKKSTKELEKQLNILLCMDNNGGMLAKDIMKELDKRYESGEGDNKEMKDTVKKALSVLGVDIEKGGMGSGRKIGFGKEGPSANNPYSKGDSVTYHKSFAFGKEGKETSKVVANHPNGKVLLDNGDSMHHLELQHAENKAMKNKND